MFDLEDTYLPEEQGLFEYMFQNGSIDLSYRTIGGATILHYAALKGDLNRVKLLIEQGADVNAKNFMGETALHAAAFSGREDAAAWLLDRGADVAAEIVREDYYRTPLMSAAWGCHPGMMRLLMEHGADIRADGTKILAMFEEDADKKARAEESGVYQLVLDALGASAAASAADKPGGMAAAVAGIPGFGIAGAAVGILPNIFGRYTASRAAGRLRGSGPPS